MGFVRILGLIVLLLGVVVAGLAFFRAPPGAPAPLPVVETPPAPPRPAPAAAPPPAPSAIMSPADMSSPAEITAREAAEAQRRLEQEAGESNMMVPDMDAPEMRPPDVAPPVKN